MRKHFRRGIGLKNSRATVFIQPQKMIRLFTTWYQSSHSARQAELDECLQHNLANPHLGQICLWQDSGAPLTPHPKILVRREPLPADFDDYFAWANAISPPGDIAIIANTDIWYDDTIRLAETITSGQAFALLRLESDGQPVLNHAGQPRWDSQDAWIFRTPIRPVGADYGFGTVHTDNALAYRLWKVGYDLRNPATDIHIHHLHASQVRRPQYNTVRIAPPWLDVESGSLDYKPRMKFIRKTFNLNWVFRRWKRRLTPKAERPR